MRDVRLITIITTKSIANDPTKILEVTSGASTGQNHILKAPKKRQHIATAKR